MLLQALPETRRMTRLALGQVLAERSLLETCAALWDDFGNALQADDDERDKLHARGNAQVAEDQTAASGRTRGAGASTALGALAEYGSDEDEM
jgi:hypothetical protein